MTAGLTMASRFDAFWRETEMHLNYALTENNICYY